MNARAVVFRDRNLVEFRGIDCPDPGDDDVVVRVLHSWISPGTEGQYLRGEHLEGEIALRPGDPSPFPIVPGYQKSGIVEWCGRNVVGFKPGDAVFAAMSKVEGMYKPMGGHVSPAVTPASQVWHIPPDDMTGAAPSSWVTVSSGNGRRRP